jgi:hypothetical protein
MMLVEADTVETEFVQFLPSIEMLGIGLNGDFGIEMTLGERVGKLAIDFQMFDVLTIGKKVEDENFHVALPQGLRFSRTLASGRPQGYVLRSTRRVLMRPKKTSARSKRQPM